MSIIAGPADAPVARFASLDVAPDLAVLIVSHQSAADLGLLFDSLRAEGVGRRIRVVVADNASTDGSARGRKGDVVVIETGGNLDYGGGLNAAMSHVGEAPAILVLHPDVSLEPGCIAALENRTRVTERASSYPASSTRSARSRSRFDVNPASSAHSATPCLAAAGLKLTEVVDSLGLPN